ncbi:hypothetical protein [Lysobacter sp. cf310]|uniref:hypothetical protein n=1 Tax=Lysobacter sp. cf310 TaxID=1761790 RepID=UPI0008EB4819|nr:hypothetical protein [Lysobacter sp. cf310]SFK29493.1 hypothetical protein SAMN04487938_0197 [Lysobacter sp. cf310]
MKKSLLTLAALAMAAPLLLAAGYVRSADAAAYSPRGQLVYQIVRKWGPHVQEAYRADMNVWARQMGPIFAKSPMNALQRAADARDFDAMNDALLGKAAANGQVVPSAIGNLAADLTFVPIAPCRIFDTRLAGGPILANSTRDFDVSSVADYSFQGGSASNCNGAGSVGAIGAAMINFAVVTPGAAGYITAYPYQGVRPLASNVNYAGGDVVSNLAVVTLDASAAASDMTVYSFAQTHLVADIVGYFIAPTPTALQCTTVQTISTMNGSASFTGTSPSCPAGYTKTGGYCQAAGTAGRVVASYPNGTLHQCVFANESPTAMQVTVYAECCRLPGR